MNSAKILHKDISNLGSRNAGANNVWRVFGTKAALPVFLFDGGRGLLIAALAQGFGLPDPLIITCAIFGMIGHNWPVFFRFQGGKGLALLSGALLYLHPLSLIMALILTFITITLVSASFKKQVSGLMPFIIFPLYLGLNIASGYMIESSMMLVMLSLFAVTMLRRMHAEWGVFSKAKSKTSSFLYLIFYDRATNDPPPLDLLSKKRIAR